MNMQDWFYTNFDEVVDILASHHASQPRLIARNANKADGDAAPSRILVSPHIEMSLLNLCSIRNDLEKISGQTVTVLTDRTLTWQSGKSISPPSSANNLNGQRHIINPPSAAGQPDHKSAHHPDAAQLRQEERLAKDVWRLRNSLSRMAAALAQLDNLSKGLDATSLSLDPIRRDALICNVARFGYAAFYLGDVLIMEPYDEQIQLWWSAVHLLLDYTSDDTDWQSVWLTAKREAPEFYALIRKSVGAHFE